MATGTIRAIEHGYTIINNVDWLETDTSFIQRFGKVRFINFKPKSNATFVAYGDYMIASLPEKDKPPMNVSMDNPIFQDTSEGTVARVSVEANGKVHFVFNKTCTISNIFLSCVYIVK